MRFSIFMLIFCAISLTAQTTASSPLKAEEIVLSADKYRGADNWGFNIEVVDFEQKESGPAEVVSRQGFRICARLFGQYPEGVFKALVQFTSPPNETGKKMLMDGGIYWMFFPDTKNLIRITPDQRLAGLATAADIASTNFASDYQGELIGEEALSAVSLGEEKNLDCYRLKLTKRHENVAYASLNYWVEKETLKPIKAEYFSLSGKLLKTAYYRQFKMAPTLGAIKIHEIFMMDGVNPGRVTRILYSDLRAEQRPEYFFRKDRFTSVDLLSTLSPAEIIKNADGYRSASAWGFNLHIKDLERTEREAKVLSQHSFTGIAKIFGEAPEQYARCLCTFTEPPSEEGKKMLMDGSIYWLFFPNTKNLVRITPEQRLAGLAAAADIAGTNFSSCYSGEFADPQEEKVMDRRCHKLVLSALPGKEVAYHKLHYWVEMETFRPVKVEYYSISGKHLKSAYYRDFKMSASMKRIMAHEIFIADPLQENRATRMFYSDLREENPPEYMFRKENLTK